MPQVTVSSKYQVLIPLDVRKKLGIRKGQKMTVVILDDVIELVPDRDLSELKGAFPHVSSENIREEGDWFEDSRRQFCPRNGSNCLE